MNTPPLPDQIKPVETSAPAAAAPPIAAPVRWEAPAPAAGYRRLRTYPAIWRETPKSSVHGFLLRAEEIEVRTGRGLELAPCLLLRLHEEAYAWSDRRAELVLPRGEMIRVVATPALYRFRTYAEHPQLVKAIRIWARDEEDLYVVDLSDAAFSRADVDPEVQMVNEMNAQAAQAQGAQQPGAQPAPNGAAAPPNGETRFTGGPPMQR